MPSSPFSGTDPGSPACGARRICGPDALVLDPASGDPDHGIGRAGHRVRDGSGKCPRRPRRLIACGPGILFVLAGTGDGGPNKLRGSGVCMPAELRPQARPSRGDSFDARARCLYESTPFADSSRNSYVILVDHRENSNCD
jgi:hypothetical protein